MVILTGCNSLSNKQLKPTNVSVQIPPPPKLSKKLLKYQPQEEVETLQQKWQKTFNDYLLNYEKLKNEAVELEGWSETVVENSNLK